MVRIIPAAMLLVAVLCGCNNEQEQVLVPLSVETRRAAIDSAMIHLDAGHTVEALAITTKLILRNPDSLEVLEKHAIVLLAEAARLESIGQFARAKDRRMESLESYRTACTMEGVAGETQFSAAQLAHMLGDIQLAKVLYEQTHLVLKNDGRSALWLAQIDLLDENWNSANHWIQESLHRQPRDPFTLISAGLIEANLNHHDKALSLTSRAINQKPNDQNLRIMQARILRICKQPSRALEILSALSNTTQSSQVVQQEISLCEELLKQTNDE